MDNATAAQIVSTYEDSIARLEQDRFTETGDFGKAQFKDGRLNEQEQIAYASQCQDYLRFGSQVDAVLTGRYPEHDAVKLSQTPPIYMEAGFRQLPFCMTQRHIRLAVRPKMRTDPHRHGLTVQQIKQFPELLAHPVMLCDSPAYEDRLLALLPAVDSDNLPLIAAIKPEGRGIYELETIETNFILSVYGKTNFQRYFETQITPDRVVYFNKKRGQDLERLTQLQLLRYYSGFDLPEHIIKPPQCVSNAGLQTSKKVTVSLSSEADRLKEASRELEKQGDSKQDPYRDQGR